MSQPFADDYIDWAGEMLMQGYDSKNLRILAGLSRTSSTYEAEDYFQQCVKELNLPVPDPEKAILAYACETAQKIVDRALTGETGVREMYQFYLATEYDRNFTIWQKLDDALDNLLAGKYPDIYGSATLENFDDIAKQEAEKFITLIKEKIAA